MLIGLRDEKASVSELPPLPEALAGAGACIVGSQLFIVGGVSSVQPVVLENSLWSLDLGTPGAQWTREAPLPGAGRAFAAVSQQYDTVVFGGLVRNGTGAGSASAETWLFRPKPAEASLRFGWSRAADIPHPAIGATAFPVGQSSVVLAGGEEKPSETLFAGRSDTPIASPPLLYQTVTDAWCSFDTPLPFNTI